MQDRSDVPGAPTFKPVGLALALLATLAATAPSAATAACPYGPEQCLPGYVWREAFTGDNVCVTGTHRSQAAQDNALAPQRRSPTVGPYGPNTCLPGYVWREAGPSDQVCVSGVQRSQAAADNALARQRRDPACAVAAPAPAPNWPIQVGVGSNDITGPAAEVVMMGYANSAQVATGIHTRLYARAFVFVSPQTGKRVAFVTADLGQLFSSVKQGVMKSLASRYGGLYHDGNVQIAATHTHAGPGGYSHHTIYNLSSFGFVRQNYDNIVDGIVAAIIQAHNSVGSATLSASTGNMLETASINRSLQAFSLNPEARSANPPPSINPEMNLLRVDGDTGPRGVIAWFSVHNTSMTKDNRLISSDHKGMAAAAFESLMGSAPPFVRPGAFVAAFPNGDEGDQSPNLAPGFHGPGVDEFDSSRKIGEREFKTARSLYDGPRMPVLGEIDFRHTFVTMPGFTTTQTAQRNGAGGQTLCQAGYGASFAAGAEDGPSGAPGFREGMVMGQGVSQADLNALRGVFNDNFVPAALRWLVTSVAGQVNDTCQNPKPVLLPTGALGWTPHILPFQLLRIGPVVVAGIPAEMSVQAGRRLRARIQSALAARGVQRVILTGLANEYSGYVTTPEEYDSQQYEGASTLYGRLTFEAYLQIFGQLADAMASGQPVAAGPTPPDLGDSQIELQSGVVYDDKRIWEQFGQVMVEPGPVTQNGFRVTATFRAGHPKNDLKRNDTYLLVERNVWGTIWQAVAWDAMPETRYIWRRDTAWDCLACSLVDVVWDVPQGTPPGIYRIRHFGAWKQGGTGAVSPYQGTTRSFIVR